MGYSLKDILKALNVLFISKKEDITNKEIEILELFFNKVEICNNIEKGLKKFSHEHPDVIIIDISLPDSNGIDFCKKVRKVNPSIPIIILSEKKDEIFLFEAIRIQVIDFIVRPMKVENMIFALNQTAKHLVNHGKVTIRLHNGYIYNYKEKTILQNNENFCQLTKNEFRLLELLLVNKHHTLSKEQIEAYLWADEDITESAFKSLFSRLRQKIGKENIQNSFGIGYQLL